MQKENTITKEELLKEIEALLTYKPEEKTTMNPNNLRNRRDNAPVLIN